MMTEKEVKSAHTRVDGGRSSGTAKRRIKSHDAFRDTAEFDKTGWNFTHNRSPGAEVYAVIYMRTV